MRVVLLVCAAVLATCAPFERDELPTGCTGSRSYERVIDLVTPQASSRTRVLYRESTTRVGRAFRVVRTVQSIEGAVDPDLVPVPENAERTVLAPIVGCPTIDSPRVLIHGEHVRVHDETRLLHVTTTW